MKPNRQSPDSPADDEALAAEIHQAIRSLGWAVPQCEADVLQAEAELAASPVGLPEELRDPKAVFDRAGKGAKAPPVSLQFPGDVAIDATLARAAREAGRITPEIEEAMRRDREAAERDLEDGKEGE
jgi:hypothetical protein